MTPTLTRRDRKDTGMADMDGTGSAPNPVESTMVHQQLPTIGDGPSMVHHDPSAGAETAREIRVKMVSSRRSHANRSQIANIKDPTKPAYTVAELEHGHGWTIDEMCRSYDDAMLGRCPCRRIDCGRMLITLNRRDISIDIIDPDLPPVWGENTQFMCIGGNSSKARKTRAQRIAERIHQLTTIPTCPAPPIPYPADSLFGDWHWRPPAP